MDVAGRRAIWFSVVLAVAGCQSGPDPSIELLESELRWMEDQLYALDRQLDQASAKLEVCQRDNSLMRGQLADVDESSLSGTNPNIGLASDRDGRRSSPSRRRSSRPGRGATSRDRRSRSSQDRPSSNRMRDDLSDDGTSNPFDDDELQLPSVDVPGLEELEDQLNVPDVDLGPGADPQWLPEPSSPQPSGGSPGADSIPTDPLPNEADNGSRAGDPHRVASVWLNPQLTGGYDFDGQPGHEGLFVVLEPRDAGGRFVAQPGRLAITVTDPLVSNAYKQLARWEFSVAETATCFKQTAVGQGITLKLPWPEQLPRSTQLDVHVQFEASPGQRPLTTNHPISVARVAPTSMSPTSMAPTATATSQSQVTTNRVGLRSPSSSVLPPGNLLPIQPAQLSRLAPPSMFAMPTGPIIGAGLAANEPWESRRSGQIANSATGVTIRGERPYAATRRPVPQRSLQRTARRSPIWNVAR